MCTNSHDGNGSRLGFRPLCPPHLHRSLSLATRSPQLRITIIWRMCTSRVAYSHSGRRFALVIRQKSTVAVHA